MAASRFVLVFLVLFLVVAVPVPAQAQAAPGPFVKQAFDLLMDRFVTPPKPGDLLKAGWDGGIAHIKGASGTELSAPAPSFTGDRGADWSAFLAGYPALVGALGTSPDQHALDRAVVVAMAKSLNHSHTDYFPTVSLPGQAYGGIGVQMSRELIVTEIFPGTPAEAAGVRPGDRLVAVDGASVEGMTSEETSSRVRGPVGSPVQLAVRRAGQTDPVLLTATRAEIVAPWATARVLEEGIGVLRINGFPALDAIGQFDAAVATLDGTDIKALVIDLRANTGGVYATSAKVASRFVREGAISQCTPRQGQMRVTSAGGSVWGRSLPLAVLVDDRSGAGAEEVASALRENGLGQLIGKHTAGRFGGAMRHPLQDGSFLNVTSHVCQSGKGAEIEGVGLEPDLTVELDPGALAEGRDTQLEAALTYLKEKIGS